MSPWCHRECYGVIIEFPPWAGRRAVRHLGTAGCLGRPEVLLPDRREPSWPTRSSIPQGSFRAPRQAKIAADMASALAHADVCIVHNDWPEWRDLTAADFAGIRRRVVVDGRGDL